MCVFGLIFEEYDVGVWQQFELKLDYVKS